MRCSTSTPGILLAIGLLALTCTFSEAKPTPPDAADLLHQLNQSRQEAGRPSLRPSFALDQVAQAVIDELVAGDEATLLAAEVTKDDLLAFGYQPHRWTQVLANSDGDAAQILERWQAGDPESFARFLDPEVAELGVGIGEFDDIPLYALIVGLSKADYFRGVAVGLSDLEAVRRRLL
jgi:hypothetical protein